MDLNAKFAPLWTNKDVRFFVVTGGRAPGKSFGVACGVASIFENEPGHVALYTRYTMSSAEESVIPEFSDKIDRLGYLPSYKKSGKNLHHDNGTTVLFRGIHTASGNQTAKLKSIPGLSMWIVDEAEEMDDENDFDTINLSIRQKGLHNRVIIICNPQHISLMVWQKFFKGKMPDGSNVPNRFNGVIGRVCYIHTTYLENLENLDIDFLLEAQEMKRTNINKYNHLFMGDWQLELAGALWNQEMIAFAKELKIDDDDLEIVCIAVDPNVSDSGDQDDAGIVGVGKTSDGFYKALKDRSGQHSPLEWAKVTLRMFIELDADYIVCEVNNGGDLVEMNIRNAADDPEFREYGIDKDSIPIEKVRATKGKLIRAEPVATLYERGKFSHAKGLEQLEAEQTTYAGGGEKSPGRLDALVWGGIFLAGIHQPRVRGT